STSDRLKLKDRFIDSALEAFDQRSANEGFLLLLFYYIILSSRHTPHFFAIENVDVALNPKLCEQFIVHMNELTIEYEKQVIVTSHNSAILDGLDLEDDQQRLFVVSRSKSGESRV